MNRKTLFLVLLTLLLQLGTAGARPAFPTELPEYAAKRGELLSVKLLTLSPGSQLYSWFGHISLIIEDEYTDRSLVFDYGVFDFNQEDFYTNFAMGRLYFRVVTSNAERSINTAVENGRKAQITTLNLPPEKRFALYSYLLTNIQPEHSTYLYHHYYDNCSTRIRDALDHTLDGQLFSWANAQDSSLSYREHIRRYTGSRPVMDFLLNFLQSSVIDRPVTLWEAMFLPDVLQQAVEEFSYTKSNGSSQSLAGEQQVVTPDTVKAQPSQPWQAHWLWWLAVGLVWMAGGLVLWWQLNTNNRFRVLFGLYNVATGITLGILGSILLFMMSMTDHDVTYGNSNIMLANPLFFLIAFGGILLLLKRPSAQKIISWGWVLVCFLSLLLLFLTFITIISQHNHLSMAVISPIAIGLGIYAARKLKTYS
ncbi:MAG: DUF4105 domain-containing protein [Spirochaetota bacterium]